MDKKSKIFFLVFLLLIIGSVALTYWRIMVKRDYIISAQTSCDPALESCFVYECDPEDPEDPECATLPEEERISYYKLIDKNAKNIPLCDAEAESDSAEAGKCPKELTCEEGEEECETILCDDSNVPEGESCNDPEQYLKDNPPEEVCSCGEEGEEATETEEDTTEETSAKIEETLTEEETGKGTEETPVCGCTAEEELTGEE